MKNKFSCCVLLPVFNNKKGLIKSLNSIDESIDLTVYIIDDGSFKPIKINSKEYGFKIKIFKNKVNKGIVDSLNIIKKIAVQEKFDFIARLDAGDICLPDRFGNQIDYLRKYNLDFCFCLLYDKIDEKLIRSVGHRFNKTNAFAKAMKLRNIGYHPALLAKRKLFSQFDYSEKYKHSEDYDIFNRWLSDNYLGCYTNSFGLVYVRDRTSISQLRRLDQITNKIKIINKYYGLRYTLPSIISLILFFLIPTKVMNFIKKTLF